VAVSVTVAVAVAVEVRVAVAVEVGVAVAVLVTVEVAVGVEVGVALAVTVTVGVAVAVGDGSVDGVAVGVRVGVALAVAVGVLDGTPCGFLILKCCEAATVFPWSFNSAVRTYWPGTSFPVLNVMREEGGLGCSESESTVRPFWPSIFSSNRHRLRGVLGDAWTVTPTWTICD
jgi:hypothetical protein